MPIGIYIRTEKHNKNISKAKKGCKQKPQCGFQEGHLQLNTGKTHFKKGSRANVGRIRLDMRGTNNHNWKGGITPINIFIRTTPKYRQWRRDVFIRDYWTCQECGHKNVKIEAHHIKSFKDFPKLRFAVSNGKTLCFNCHKELRYD